MERCSRIHKSSEAKHREGGQAGSSRALNALESKKKRHACFAATPVTFQTPPRHNSSSGLLSHLLLRVAPVLETHLAMVHPRRDRRRRPELPAEPRADRAVVGRGQRVRGRREAPPGAERGAAVLNGPSCFFFAERGGRGLHSLTLRLYSFLGPRMRPQEKDPPRPGE